MWDDDSPTFFFDQEGHRLAARRSIDTGLWRLMICGMSNSADVIAKPLANLDEWEDDVKTRYPEPGVPAFNATDPTKKQEHPAKP